MAPPSTRKLQRIAAATGYQTSTVEKGLRLLDLLVEINRHPLLTGRLALKGGTALNVFHLDYDRLSVDIDLNYIGALDKAIMQCERPHVDAAINQLLASQGYSVRRQPEEYAGGKWSTRFNSALGGNATLEVDISYMDRQPLFGAVRMQSSNLCGTQASDILVLDIHEIVAGKLVALFERCAPRDLFDARRILSIQGLNWGRIKTAVLAIGASHRPDWRHVSTNAIVNPDESSEKLKYCLPRDYFAENGGVDAWINESVAMCRKNLGFLCNLSTNEQAFLDGVLDRGEINTTLLDTDDETQSRISNMPMLAWKALHVRSLRERTQSTESKGDPVKSNKASSQEDQFKP